MDSTSVPSQPDKPKYVGRGGWRGGGRPKGRRNNLTLLSIEKRAEVQEMIFRKHFKDLIAIKLELAKGDYYYQKIDGISEKVKVYKAAPDRASVDWLIEFVVGKTPDKLESDNKHDIPQLDTLATSIQQILQKK